MMPRVRASSRSVKLALKSENYYSDEARKRFSPQSMNKKGFGHLACKSYIFFEAERLSINAAAVVVLG